MSGLRQRTATVRPRQSAALHRWKEPKSSKRSALFSGTSVSHLSISANPGFQREWASALQRLQSSGP
jgi:hypothetical protein